MFGPDPEEQLLPAVANQINPVCVGACESRETLCVTLLDLRAALLPAVCKQDKQITVPIIYSTSRTVCLTVCMCSEVVEDVLYAARSPVGGTDKRWLPPLLPQRRTGGASLTDLPHTRLFT